MVPLQCYKPLPATKDELATFHSTDYLDFLQTVTTENKVRKAQASGLEHLGVEIAASQHWELHWPSTIVVSGQALTALWQERQSRTCRHELPAALAGKLTAAAQLWVALTQ